MKGFWGIVLLGLLLLTVQVLQAQEINIELSNAKVPLNGTYKIAVAITGAEVKTYAGFPEIQGFIKKGISTTSSVDEDNPDGFQEIIIEQTYAPLREGRFVIPPFSFQVNGKSKKVKGSTVTVISAIEENNKKAEAIFEEEPSQFEEEIIGQVTNNKNQPFLQIVPSKKQVYQGEGVVVKLCFYLPDNYPNEIQFYKLNEQIAKIITSFRTTSCWEVDFQLNEVKQKKIVLNKVKYTEFKIYQAAFYPFNDQPIDIKPISLQFSVLKETKKKGLFGVKVQEVIQSFQAGAQRIFVKPLPMYPSSGAVPVGEFTMREAISKNRVTTGQNIKYEMEITGNGYSGNIQAPQTDEDFAEVLDVFPPKINQTINQSDNNLSVKKKFTFEIVPLKADTTPLSRLFQFVFFSPSKNDFDTLSSQITLFTTGNTISIKSEKNSASYWYSNAIKYSSETSTPLFAENNNRFYFNIALGIVFVLGIAIILWPRK